MLTASQADRSSAGFIVTQHFADQRQITWEETEYAAVAETPGHCTIIILVGKVPVWCSGCARYVI